MTRKLLTLDESPEERDRLSLAVLSKAGEGSGPLAEAARKAHQEYTSKLDAGAGHAASLTAAREALYAALPGRR